MLDINNIKAGLWIESRLREVPTLYLITDIIKVKVGTEGTTSFIETYDTRLNKHTTFMQEELGQFTRVPVSTEEWR